VAAGALLTLSVSDHELVARALRLRWLLCDVDGVLTDGRLYYAGEGDPLQAFDIKDGLALKLAQHAGLLVGVLSGRSSKAVAARTAELRLDAVVLGRLDKGTALREFALSHGADLDEIAYVGDDLPDLPALRLCGLGFAPSDAVAEARGAAHRVLASRGGRGAVREVVELLLKARGDWERVIAPFTHSR
jgi:3-deoxy-D-manno-octulosonate 8-phosphate phosphatase (KDO 8-P phosphatase)